MRPCFILTIGISSTFDNFFTHERMLNHLSVFAGSHGNEPHSNQFKNLFNRPSGLPRFGMNESDVGTSYRFHYVPIRLELLSQPAPFDIPHISTFTIIAT